MKALALLLCLLPGALMAQLAEAPLIPQLMVTVSPETALRSNGYVNGQLILHVQLISRHPFEELAVTPPRLETAEVVPLARPRTRKISGYAGEGHVYEAVMAIFPREAGTLIIPPVTAVGAVEPKKDRELRFDLASEPLDIVIAPPPAGFRGDRWLPASRVEIDESWSVPVEEIRVGEVVRRGISLRVWGVAAERLPELEHPPARGVRISLGDVSLRTETSAEGLIGHADYVWDLEVETPQVVFVKPVAVDYWDTEKHGARVASAPANRIEPLPPDSEALAAALMQEAAANRERTRFAALALLATLIAPVLAALTALGFAALPTRADRRLRRSLNAAPTPEAVYNALEDWRAASGLAQRDAVRRIPARARLANHLFAPGHPEAGAPADLAAEALAWSRRVRVASAAARMGIGRGSKSMG